MTSILTNPKAFLTLFAVVVLGFGLVWFLFNLPDPVIDFLFKSVLNRRQEQNFFAEDGLYVITTGTGAPLPDDDRAGPQAVVVAGDEILIFDAGPGSTHNLEMIGLDTNDITALFMTHYHSDHIGDMGELMLKHWATAGATEPLPIYGPPGLEEVLAGFEAAYSLDQTYRVAHHGTETMPPTGFGGDAHLFDLGTDLMASQEVYQSGDVEVIAFNVDHKPVFPAVGYRVNYKDRSVVITGDTIYTESLVKHAMGADVLVSEALNHKFADMLAKAGQDSDTNVSAVAEDIQTYHITPEEVGIVARDAEIPTLLITHILPPVRSKILVNPFLRELHRVYDGSITMANDGTMVKLLVDSEKVTIKELLK